MTGAKAKWLPATLIAAALGVALLSACGSSSASGSEQFRDKTGSALLDFGEESSDVELEEATKAVQSFFGVRSKEDWPATCAQLSRALLEKIEHLAVSSTSLGEKSCPSFLEAFLRISAPEQRESTVIDAGSLRRQGAQGFLIYSGAQETVYAMPLSQEGGTWKIGSLSPKRLS